MAYLPHYDNMQVQCSSEKANSNCKYNTYGDMLAILTAFDS